jgi:hypothetical protein
MGFFALIFLLTGFRKILRVGGAKKVLGLIGCSGLVVHAILALFMPLSWGTPAASVGTGGNLPIAQSGPENWTVNGRTYNISSTYFLNVREGFQYTVEYPYHFGDTDRNMNDEHALAIVFPLMKHAYAEGLYKRMAVAKVGQGEMTPTRIGITLFEKDGANTKGYRVGLSLDQIKQRIATEATTAPSGSSQTN